MDIQYIASKDGISFSITDTKKSHYENLGYEVELYVEPVKKDNKKAEGQ